MALISCPECKAEISDTAAACPHCGYSLKALPKESLGPMKLCKECKKEILKDVEDCPYCGHPYKISDLGDKLISLVLLPLAIYLAWAIWGWIRAKF